MSDTDPITRLNAALEGRYRIESELGEGGMATVYLADDIKHERKVALKVLKPELAAVVGAERFLAEIKTTANLTHPNILPLFDSGEADSFVFYVMPYVEGESLRDKLDREHQLPVDDAVRIASDVAEALGYAHGRGVIHRDIKPANILIQAGRPGIADFGIALAVSAGGAARLTETGLSVGTPHYMSPEQATGDQTTGPATDTYALGCVLYEMLVGEPPYTGSTPQAILGKIITGSPESVTAQRKSVPINVDAAISKALEKLPADRFTDAHDLARALADPRFGYAETPRTAISADVEPWRRLSILGWSVAVLSTVAFGWSLSRPDPPGSVRRHSVALPDAEGLQNQRGTRLALSPDGSQMVYVGPGEEGGTRLWIRPEDQLNATPIPGTENGIHPFFAPDGTRLGFMTLNPRVLKVVPLAGGLPITLADFGVGLDGASWGPDGFVYGEGLTFGGDSTRGLVRVPETGGDPEVVTTIALDQGERDHSWPEALPNGAGVLFTISYGTGIASRDLAVLDLVTGEYRVLIEGVAAKYAHSGHLLYVTADGSLMAAPFDQDELAITGSSTKLLEGLGIGAFGSLDLALSATGVMAYITGRPSTGPQEPVWLSRDGRIEQVDPGWVGVFGSLALSPDGRHLAVSLRDEAGGEQVWIKQLPGGPLTQLTFGDSRNYSPRWTPDGRAVTFISERGENADLYRKNVDGSGEAVLVLDDERPVGEGFYSRDGRWVLYRLGASTHSRDLLAQPVGSGEESHQIAASGFAEEDAALSPDGRWVAFVSRKSGRNEVYVRPFPEPGIAESQLSTAGGDSPLWSHDGTELFYQSSTNELHAVEVRPGTAFTTGERNSLFSLTEYLQGIGVYDLSATDQRFIFLHPQIRGPRDELVVVHNFFEELKERVPN